MNITPKTMALANKVLDYIKTYPERHNQASWVEVSEQEGPEYINEYNVCRSTMCVAGTAVFLSRPLDEFRKVLDGDFEPLGEELLGLDEDEAEWLFYAADNENAVKALEAIAKGDQSSLDELIDS